MNIDVAQESPKKKEGGPIIRKIVGAVPYAAAFAVAGSAAYWLSGGSAVCVYLVVLGGLVGATTNAIAIGMLFRKYFKWGDRVLGDYIGRNYKDFIQKMTGMVGNLVNYKTIAPVVKKPEFKAEVKNIVRNTVEEKLPSESAGLKLEDIRGIEESAGNIVNLINEAAPGLLGKIIEIAGRYPIDKILSREQFEYIVDKNADSMIMGIKSERALIKEALASFLSNTNIKGIVSPSAITAIRGNIDDVIENMNLPECGKEIDGIYHGLEEGLNLNSLISRIEGAVGRMALSDFITGVTGKTNVSKELLNRVVGFAETSDGKKALVNVAEKIIKNLERINLKLSDVISVSARDCLINGINDNLPDFINETVGHINKTKYEIEKLIDEAVDEELDSSGLWGKVLLLLKNIFINGSIAKKYSIVNRISEAIEKYGDRAGDELTKKLLEYIEKESIGRILADVQKAYPKMADSLVELVVRNLRDTQNVNWVDAFLSKRIADIGAIDLSIIKKDLLPKFFERFKKEYLYNRAWLRRGADKIVDVYAEKSASEYLDAGKIADRIIDAATGNKTAFRNFLLSLYEDFSKIEISRVISADLASHVKLDKSSIWESGKKLELKDIYNLFRSDDIYTLAAENFSDLLEENPDSLGKNIDTVLSKEITNVANTELNKFKKEKVVKIVNDFIGTHLGTITAIGAGAGIAVSVVLYWIFNFVGYNELFFWPQNLNQWIQTVVTVAIMAFVGWGTNCLAIWTLFHPYEPKWWRLNFVGIAIRGRKKFSEGIADFINREALDKGAVKRFFSENKRRVKDGFTQYMEKDNYNIIDSLIKNAGISNKIRAFVLEKTRNHIRENPSNISNGLVSQLEKYLQSGDLKSKITVIGNSLLKIINERSPQIASIVENRFIAGKKTGNYQNHIWEAAKKLIDTMYGNFVEWLNRENIRKYVISKDEYFHSYTSNKTLRTFIGEKAVSGISQWLSSIISDKLPDLIPFLINIIEKTELDTDKRIKDLFGGKLHVFFKTQITYITDMIHEEISKERENIKSEIHSQAGLLRNLAAGKQIDNVIDAIIDGKLKKYLRSEREFFERAGDNIIFNKKLSDFGIRDSILAKGKLEGGIRSILESRAVVKGLQGIAEATVNNFSDIHLKEFLRILGIRNISNLLEVLNPVIEEIYPDISERISNNSITELVLDKSGPLILKLINGITLTQLLSNINLEKELTRILNTLLKNAPLAGALKSAMNTAFIEDFTTGKLKYDENLLRDKLSAFISLFEEKNWNESEGAANQALDKLLGGICSALTPETKRHIISDIIVPALLDSCEDNADKIIMAMDVREIVRNETGRMPPEKIEGLFEFAKGYFRTIKMWGFAGGLQAFIVIGWLIDECRIIWDARNRAENG